MPSSGNIRELEALAPAFISWYGEQPFRADLGDVLESLTCFFRFYPEFNGTRTITALEPTEVAAKLASLITHAVLEGCVATYSLMRFLDFLHDSGLWSGSQDSFRAVQGIVEDILCSDLRITIRYGP